MALNFPSGPSLNQIYTDSERTWRYNGTGWEIVATNTFSTTPITVLSGNIDCGAGVYFVANILSITTLSVSNVPGGAYAFTLELNMTGGGINWFSGIDWQFNTQPTFSTSASHLVVLVTKNGGINWKGAALRNFPL